MVAAMTAAVQVVRLAGDPRVCGVTLAVPSSCRRCRSCLRMWSCRLRIKTLGRTQQQRGLMLTLRMTEFRMSLFLFYLVWLWLWAELWHGCVLV